MARLPDRRKPKAVTLAVGEPDPWRDDVDTDIRFLKRESRLTRSGQTKMQAAQAALQTQLASHLKSDEDSFIFITDAMTTNGKLIKEIHETMGELTPIITATKAARRGGRYAMIVAAIGSKVGRAVMVSAAFCVAAVALFHGGWRQAAATFLEYLK